MDRIFMDRGSSLNTIFVSTLHKMLIPRSVWKKSSTEIHGVVPGETATSLGAIELEVVFGSKRNFAGQKLKFGVFDWQSMSPAILERPEFPQSMAVLHYSYLQLKRSGSTGVFTVKGSFPKSDQCDR